MTAFRKFSFLISVVTLSISVSAHSQSESLRRKVYRPTIQEVIDDHGKPINGMSKNPFLEEGKKHEEWSWQASIIEETRTEFPHVIAAVEYNFPGAIILPLGRDAAHLGDMFDAFYTNIGQKNRVRRIHASGASLDVKLTDKGKLTNTTVNTLYDFLHQTTGLDLERIDEMPPFIIVDRTGYSETSQTTTYLKAIYRKGHELGIPLDKMLRKVNAISSKGSYTASDVTREDIAYDFEEAERDIDDKRNKKYELAPRKILFLEMSTFTDGPVWHETYTEMERKKNGHVRTFPGPASEIEHKVEVLCLQFEALKITSTNAFLNNVKKYARDFGYIYKTSPLKPGENYEAYDFSNGVKDSIGKIFSDLKATPQSTAPRKHDFSEAGELFGKALSNSIESARGDYVKMQDASLLFLKAAGRAYQNSLISGFDAMKLIYEILLRVPMDDEFAEQWRKIATRDKLVRWVLFNQGNFFRDKSADYYGESAKKQYKQLMKAIGQIDPCDAV